MSGELSLKLIRGDEARELLASAAFEAEWAALWEQCPWATAFQKAGYAKTWYRVYREQYQPILITARDGQGQLRGLLTLAIRSKRIVVAGDFQAEYQAWICPAELGDAFPLQFMGMLRREMPRAVLRFHYLPPGTPRGWLKESAIKDLYLIKPHPRPLLRFEGGAQVAQSLSKKSNKSRIKQMERAGGSIVFRHVTDGAESEMLLDRLIPYHDARHMAVRGAAPFENDRLRREFALALMRVPGLLHVSAFSAGTNLAAAHLGGIGKKEVQFGLVAHNPWLAKFSPGKFQILYLAKMLHEQGFEQLDLTAGGDPYKERFANAWDEVHTLEIFPSAASFKKGKFRGGVEERIRATLKRLNMTPAQAKLVIGKAKRPAALIGDGLRRLRNWASGHCETRVYSFSLPAGNGAAADDGLHRDACADLLHYRPTSGWPTRQEFVSAAVEKAEQGQRLYTRVENGRLAHVAWLADRPAEEVTAALFPGRVFPADTALVEAIHTFGGVPQAEEWTTQTLHALLRDAAASKGTRQLLLLVPGTDRLLQSVAEQLGGHYEGSTIEQCRFGRKERRIEVAMMPAAPPPAPPAANEPVAATASEPKVEATEKQRETASAA